MESLAKKKSLAVRNVGTPDIDEVRVAASEKLDQTRRVALGQFMTPSAIARFMVALFQKWPEQIELLDAGAGVGSLSEAFAHRFAEIAPVGAQLTVAALRSTTCSLAISKNACSI
jgi:predicted RNA methylase